MHRIWKAFQYSLGGLFATYKSEPAFKLELVLTIFLIPSAFYLGTDVSTVSILIATLLLVLITELANTALEALADETTTEIKPLIKKAKDAGSAMVFVALINVIMVWGLVILCRTGITC